MQAIALAGGLSPFAASRRIQVHRKINGADTIFLFNFKTFEVRHRARPRISIFDQAISSLFLNEACLNEACGQTATAPNRTVVL